MESYGRPFTVIPVGRVRPVREFAAMTATWPRTTRTARTREMLGENRNVSRLHENAAPLTVQTANKPNKPWRSLCNFSNRSQMDINTPICSHFHPERGAIREMPVKIRRRRSEARGLKPSPIDIFPTRKKSEYKIFLLRDPRGRKAPRTGERKPCRFADVDVIPFDLGGTIFDVRGRSRSARPPSHSRVFDCPLRSELIPLGLRTWGKLRGYEL